MAKKHPSLGRLSRLLSDDCEFISRINRSLAKWKDNSTDGAAAQKRNPIKPQTC